jgi:hypothetical protein
VGHHGTRSGCRLHLVAGAAETRITFLLFSWIRIMWKLLIGFIVFAAVALFVLKKAGGNVDMGGEKHGAETHAASEPAAASATAPAVAASVVNAAAAAAASAAASAASN